MFKNLNAEQARFDMSNADVAEKLGITRQTYELKKANGKFTLAEVRTLCQMFDCGFDYLFEVKEKP